MVAFNDDIRPSGRRADERVLPIPLWLVIVRALQLIIAVVLVGLTGYAYNVLEIYLALSGYQLPGYSLCWFTFSWTALFFIYMGVSSFFVPVAYNYWGHIAIESITCLFWLVTFAVLASESVTLSTWLEPTKTDYEYFGGGALVPTATNNPADNFNRPTSTSFIKARSMNLFEPTTDDSPLIGVGCTKAAAGLGALEWLLFVASLVGVGFLIYRRRQGKFKTIHEESTVNTGYKMQQMAVPPNRPYRPQ